MLVASLRTNAEAEAERCAGSHVFQPTADATRRPPATEIHALHAHDAPIEVFPTRPRQAQGGSMNFAIRRVPSCMALIALAVAAAPRAVAQDVTQGPTSPDRDSEQSGLETIVVT